MTIQKGRISDANYDGYSRYCGPTSLSAITGKGTKEICKRLRKMTGRNAIRGMYNFEMLKLLDKLGYKCEHVYRATTTRRTLQKWHDEYARGRDVYLVQVGHHYVVVHNKQIVCTSNSGKLGPVCLNKYLRCRVKNVWRIS